MSYIINVDYCTMDDIATHYDLVYCYDADEYYPADDCYYCEDEGEWYSSHYTLHYCEDCGCWYSDSAWNYDQERCINCQHELCNIGGYHDGKYDQDLVISDCDNEIADYTNFCGVGIEIEVENPSASLDELDKHAGQIQNIISSGYTRTEEDCSLDNGFEIITAPHSELAYNETLKNQIEAACNYLTENGFISWDSGRCGLHLHYSRNYFGDNYAERQYNITRLIQFYNYNFELFEKLAGRKENAYCRKNKTYSEGHGYAVNTGNDETIEFRLGRGTLNFERIEMWIDLHFAIVKNAKKKIDINDWGMWTDGISDRTRAYIQSNTNAINEAV